MSRQLEALATKIGFLGSLSGIGVCNRCTGHELYCEPSRAKHNRQPCHGIYAISGVLVNTTNLLKFLLVLSLFGGVVFGVLFTILLTLAMNRADPRIAGSSFALIMAVYNIGGASGNGVAIGLTDTIGFANTFRLHSIMGLVAVFLLWLALGWVPMTDTQSEGQRI